MKRLAWYAREFNGQRVGDCFFLVSKIFPSYFQISREVKGAYNCFSSSRDPC
jgi:hypothetical protein